ncbi:MAG: aminotransferase class III-fold pyridoxal phosphate-dependent enzyme [Planctomycetaceae bacterium]|nr:aminotransferase class III-fold pyridoxal phosphate-dependent enzyme [Planctomycetaceae bacterium]
MIKIAVVDELQMDRVHALDFDRWRSFGGEITLATCRTEDELIDVCHDAPIVVSIGDTHPFNERVLGELKQCVLLQRVAVGYDSVDVKAATRLGIIVANGAGFCDEEVANHALAMMLGCHQQLPLQQHNLLEGKWNPRLDPPTRRLSIQTLGIVGLGRLGRAFATHARPLVGRLLAYDPVVTESEAARVGAELVDFETLLGESDHVSLHCPLMDETRSLINADTLRLMKPTACLINTARGPIVDIDALYDALANGRLRGAGLDVFPEEPLPKPLHRLFSLPNVIVTPHCAASSPDALDDLWVIVSDNVADLLQGRLPSTIINRNFNDDGRGRFTSQIDPPKPHSVERSMQTYERACHLIPGGTQLLSRRPSKFAYGVSPAYAVSAKGARFTDVDGNEYIDWVSGIGAIILGYADPVVDEAVREQMSKGTIYSINHELEVELAEELVNLIPCAEMVRYAKGGGDACAVAVRIARGATGRDKILFSGYHGWQDWYLAANLQADKSLDAHLFPGIDPTGVPQCLEGTAIPFPYGDAAALADLLDQHKGEVAAIMMEPLRSNWPPEGYLDEVRKLASDAGVVLIFDEVSTGFRFSPGGVQPILRVEPDMAVFAKSISNGYPMGAVVGRRWVMEPAANMFISSTYWSDTIGLRAALTTLREIGRRNVPEQLDQLGKIIQSQLAEVAQETGAPVRCGGVCVHPQLSFDIEDATLARQVSTLYIQEMAKRGCHGYTSFYLNAAQGPAEVEQTVKAARDVFAIITDALQQGDVKQRLECELKEDVFRRLVS